MWAFKLLGDDSDLVALTRSLTGPDLNVTRDGADFLLMSDRILDSDDPATVRNKAEALITRLNGACRVALGSLQPIGLGGAYHYGDDGKKDTTVAYAEKAHIRFRGVAVGYKLSRADGTVEVSHPADAVRRWAELPATDSAVDTVFGLLSKELDWTNLNRIKEAIAGDVGGWQFIVSQGWATEAALSLFRKTANHPLAAGLEARHGFRKEKPPQNPMPISDAKTLILNVVSASMRNAGDFYGKTQKTTSPPWPHFSVKSRKLRPWR